MKCEFTKSDGRKCNANKMRDSRYCFSHNPSAKAKKIEAVTTGGRAPKPRREPTRLQPLSVKSIEDIAFLIEDTVNRVRTDPMTHQKANCVGYLANVALKAIDQGEIASRLKDLEKRIEEFIKKYE